MWFTHQYDGLEALYKKYKDQGLEIIAVPSNQFGEEEPGSNNENPILLQIELWCYFYCDGEI